MNTGSRFQQTPRAVSLRLAVARWALGGAFILSLLILVNDIGRPLPGMLGGTGPGPGQTQSQYTPTPVPSG